MKYRVQVGQSIRVIEAATAEGAYLQARRSAGPEFSVVVLGESVEQTIAPDSGRHVSRSAMR